MQCAKIVSKDNSNVCQATPRVRRAQMAGEIKEPEPPSAIVSQLVPTCTPEEPQKTAQLATLAKVAMKNPNLATPASTPPTKHPCGASSARPVNTKTNPVQQHASDAWLTPNRKNQGPLDATIARKVKKLLEQAAKPASSAQWANTEHCCSTYARRALKGSTKTLVDK